MAVGGLDIGTSAVKCALYDDTGRQIGLSQRDYRIISVDNRYFELDARVVWENAKAVLAEAASQAGQPIDGIAVSALGSSALALDQKDNVLSNALLFNDIRGQEESVQLIKKFGQEKLFNITGVVSNGTFVLEKLAWIKNHAEFFQKINRFVLFEDFIIYMLTGDAAISYSLATSSAAFNVVEKHWQNELFDVFGLNNRIMSRPCPSGTPVGQIKPALADELGINRNMLVLTGGHDTFCCSAGAGMFDTELIVDVSGTCEAISMAMEKPRRDQFMLDAGYNCVPYVIPNLYSTFMLGPCSGSLLQWFKNCFYEGSAIANAGESFFSAMDREVGEDPSGIIVLPSFSVSGPPDFSLNARGIIDGLNLTTKDTQIYRALMEGAAYHMLNNLEIWKQNGIQPKMMRVVGGASNSPVWMQIKSDIFGMPLEAVMGNMAGATGCAIIAAVGLGQAKTYKEAGDRMIKTGVVYTPDMKRREKYLTYYQRFLQIYQLGRSFH